MALKASIRRESRSPWFVTSRSYFFLLGGFELSSARIHRLLRQVRHSLVSLGTSAAVAAARARGVAAAKPRAVAGAVALGERHATLVKVSATAVAVAAFAWAAPRGGAGRGGARLGRAALPFVRGRVAKGVDARVGVGRRGRRGTAARGARRRRLLPRGERVGAAAGVRDDLAVRVGNLLARLGGVRRVRDARAGKEVGAVRASEGGVVGQRVCGMAAG